MVERKPVFRWNAGGWFGPQIGATAWILLAGLLTFPRDPVVASLVLTVFVVANLVGTVLWLKRSRLRAFPTMQGLIIIAGVAGVAATFILQSAGEFRSLGRGGEISARSMYVIIGLMVPALLLLFFLIERTGRGRGDPSE